MGGGGIVVGDWGGAGASVLVDGPGIGLSRGGLVSYNI